MESMNVGQFPELSPPGRAALESSQDGNSINEQSFSYIITPMLNPVVLSHLFEVCDTADIPRFRLVSKEWHSSSLARFRKERWLVIYYFYTPAPQRGVQWEFLGDDHMTFRNFRITEIDFGHPSENQPTASKSQRNIGQFWKKYGGFIRKLRIDSAAIHSRRAFERAMFEETPNLEELHLGANISESTTNGPLDQWSSFEEKPTLNLNMKRIVVFSYERLPNIPLGDLIQHFPNIQDLEELTDYPRYSLHENERKLTEISEQLRKASEHIKWKVCSLSLKPSNLNEIRTATRTVQIPRIIQRNLDIDVKDYNGVPHEASNLVSAAFLHHGETLESLRISAQGGSPSPYANFPFHPGPLNSFVKLDLSGNCCPSLDFLDHFPNIQVLKVVDCEMKILEDSTDSVRMKETKLSHLTELRFEFVNRKCITEEAMEMLAKVMPNVEIFDGNLSNSSLRVVCREWKQLKELRMREAFPRDPEGCLDDEGITGIVDGCLERRMPNITDLKELKYLTIPRGAKSSDASVWNGFLKLPRLQNLNVELSCETSDAAFEVLRTHFPSIGISKNSRYSWLNPA